jgi:hypothetical protein
MYKSMSRELDLSGILAPLGEFGKWISGLLPTFKVTIQDYIKMPLSGLPEYVIAFEAEITFNCGVLNDIGNAVKSANELIRVIDPDLKIYKAVWPTFMQKFCNQERSISAKISVGFTGFYIDPPNTYIEIATESWSGKLSMADLPVCPAPVKHVCAFGLNLTFFCSNNDISYFLSALRVVIVR